MVVNNLNICIAHMSIFLGERSKTTQNLLQEMQGSQTAQSNTI